MRAESYGVPPTKMIVGLSLWARSYTLHSKGGDEHSDHKVGIQTNGWGFPGKYTNVRGKLGYFEVCEKRENQRLMLPLMESDQVMGSWIIAVYGQWISFNHPGKDLDNKISYIQQRGYAGVGLYSIDADDSLESCRSGRFPLLRYVTQQLTCKAEIKREAIQNAVTATEVVTTTTITPPQGQLEHTASQQCIRMCYYRPKLDVAPINFNALSESYCSHIAIGFLDIGSDGTVTFAPEIALALRNFLNWNSRSHARKPKLVLSVGGQQMVEEWRTVVRNETHRRQFVRELIRLVHTHGAGGVDIHWVAAMNSDSDRDSLTGLLQEIKREFEQENLGTSLVLTVTPQHTYAGMYDTGKITSVVDLFHLRGGMFADAQSAKSAHHDPLISSELHPRMSMKAFASYWAHDAQVSKSQLVLGITAEAMTQRLTHSSAAALPHLELPTIGPGQPANETKRAGKAAFFEVLEIINKSGSRKRFLAEIGAPVASYNEDFIAYNDVESIRRKATWASFEGYAGVALFSIEYDDVKGVGGHGPFPLLKELSLAFTCRGECRMSQPLADDKVSIMTPLTASSRVFCDYRIPTALSKDPMEPSSIPWEKCSDVVLRTVTLDRTLRMALPDKVAARYFQQTITQQGQTRRARLIVSIRCDMNQENFLNILNPTGTDKARLVNEIRTFIAERSLDGVEMDCSHLVDTSNKDDYNKLLTNLAQAAATAVPPFPIGIRIPGWKTQLRDSYVVDTLNEHLDFVTLVASKYSSLQDQNARLASPLYAHLTGGGSISKTIDEWTNGNGLHSQKIVLMLPAFAVVHRYSPRGSRASAGLTGIGASLDGPARISVTSTSEPGMATYSEVCELTSRKRIEETLVLGQVAVYANGGSLWLSYETQATLLYKAHFAKGRNLGGIGLTALNDDDHKGTAKCHLTSKEKKFPLLNVINHC